MTLKEIEDKLKGKFEVTKFSTYNSYTIKLGSHGTINVQYKDNKFYKLTIDGNDRAEIEKLLLGEEKNDK